MVSAPPRRVATEQQAPTRFPPCLNRLGSPGACLRCAYARPGCQNRQSSYLILRLALGEQLLGLLAIEVINAPALNFGIEHVQGSAAGIDLVVMGEIGEPLQDADQVLVPAASQDPSAIEP